MPRQESNDSSGRSSRPVSLKQLAKHLSLSPTTISLVLNGSAVARSIPQDTKDRVIAAARKLGYRPNFVARSLRSQRSYSVGVLLPELSHGYMALVLSGIEDFLLQAGYMYLVTCHRHDEQLTARYFQMLLERSVEGLIAVDTPCDHRLPVPVVSISGHRRVEGITNIVLNHTRAAELALRHLVELGHRRIAFFKGQAFSSDTEVRFKAQRVAAGLLGLPVEHSLVVQLEGNSPSPEVGHVAARKLLDVGEPFTALLSFNDIYAIGAIRALREARLRVPEDVSVVGFDDAEAAAFHSPALTTVRQPLREMGRLAAEVLLNRITSGSNGEAPALLRVEPELIVRESTARARP